MVKSELRMKQLPSGFAERVMDSLGKIEGRIIGMDTFGESAPAGELFKMFGFTTDNVVNTAQELLS